jgi:bifunctional enzyme CysN/CysC
VSWKQKAHLCKLINQQGIIVICSFISPDESIREQIKEIVGEDKFKRVYLDANIEYYKDNDKCGIYKLA